MGHKPIVAIHTRPEDEEAGATWQWQAEPSRRRKRGPSAVAAAAAAAAAVDDDDEDEEDDEEEEQRRRRRRRGKPTAPATITPALTTGAPTPLLIHICQALKLIRVCSCEHRQIRPAVFPVPPPAA